MKADFYADFGVGDYPVVPAANMIRVEPAFQNGTSDFDDTWKAHSLEDVLGAFGKLRFVHCVRVPFPPQAVQGIQRSQGGMWNARAITRLPLQVGQSLPAGQSAGFITVNTS